MLIFICSLHKRRRRLEQSYLQFIANIAIIRLFPKFIKNFLFYWKEFRNYYNTIKLSFIKFVNYKRTLIKIAISKIDIAILIIFVELFLKPFHKPLPDTWL